MNEGDFVLIRTVHPRKRRSWLLKLKKDEVFSTHLGQLSHNELLSKDYGDFVKMLRGKVVVLKPTPRDFVHCFRLKTNIMYEDDCSAALTLAGVGSGQFVGEAGTGSGGLTSFLAFYIRPMGKVFTFDSNENHLQTAKHNLMKVGLDNFVDFIHHDIREDYSLDHLLDAFFLDFSTPWEAISTVSKLLKNGGRLVCFVPNWGQVEQTVDTIQRNDNLILGEVFEINRRDFKVDPEDNIMRPKFRSIVYSGILIQAIKTSDQSKRRQ